MGVLDPVGGRHTTSTEFTLDAVAALQGAVVGRVTGSDIETWSAWEDQTEVNIRCAARRAQGESR